MSRDSSASLARVHDALAQLFEAPTVWISVMRAAHEGRACRDYVVHDAAGAPLLDARAFPWRRDIALCYSLRPDPPLVRIRRRLSFPVTGKFDVFDEHVARIGVVSRSGVYRDERGSVTGRFRDARSSRQRTRESLFIGIMDALFGGSATVADTSGPDGYVWVRDGSTIGALTRAPLPFGIHETEPSTIPVAESWAGQIAARMLHAARHMRQLTKPTPRGWKLERHVNASVGDHRIVIAAALLAIELSHW